MKCILSVSIQGNILVITSGKGDFINEMLQTQ